VNVVGLRRSATPWVHVKPLFELVWLMRSERFDMVHTHSPVAGLLGRLAAWIVGGSVNVAMIHGFLFHEGLTGWRRRMFIAQEWLLGPLTDVFLYVSDEDRVTSERLGIQREGTPGFTVYNGVDTQQFRPARLRPGVRARVRTELRIDPAARVIGIVARVVKEKGFREFLGMASALSGRATFMVVGDSLTSDRDQFSSEFRREIAAAGMVSSFRFVGLTEEVDKYLCAMDIFVLPTYREGFPVSILEAMSAELPVVTTNVRGCRESVIHGVTGLLVPPRDAHALARAVAALLDDPGKATSMGRAGRMRVTENFSKAIVQAAFLEALSPAVDRRALLA
jgi:glycosyltransferase involved in cell wall biosynthesis